MIKRRFLLLILGLLFGFSRIMFCMDAQGDGDQSLQIRRAGVSSETLLHMLRERPNLEEIVFFETNDTTQGAIYKNGHKDFPIAISDPRCQHITDEHVLSKEALDIIATLKNLRILSLGSSLFTSNITDDFTGDLADNDVPLRVLHADGWNKVAFFGWRRIGFLRGLTELVIKRALIRDSHVEFIAYDPLEFSTYEKLPALCKLHLIKCCPLTTQSFRHVVRCSSLIDFRFDSFDLVPLNQDDFLAFAKALGGRLLSLHLENWEILSFSLFRLFTQLQSLMLNVKVGAEGLTQVCRAIGTMRTLKHLKLFLCGDEGEWPKFTAEQLMLLVGSLENLEKIELRQDQVDDAGLEFLRRYAIANPACRVFCYDGEFHLESEQPLASS